MIGLMHLRINQVGKLVRESGKGHFPFDSIVDDLRLLLAKRRVDF
jgi:hypothetical protein